MWTTPTLHVGRGTFLDGVTVFPVWVDAPAVRGLDTGQAARVRVEERAGSPVVGQLVVHNTGARPAMLLEGELLEGGHQHRALVGDVILAPGAGELLPVACVEQGRWAGGSDHRRGARRATAAVRACLRGDEGRRQGDVWSRVARHAPVTGPSPTGSLLDHLDSADDGRPHRELRVLPGQRGVVIGVDGRALVLEVFGSGKLLAAHLPGLLAAARLETALVPATHRVPVQGYRARDMAAHLDGVRLKPTDRSGLGVAVEGATSHASLRGIAVEDGALAHLSVLNTRHPLLEAV